MSERFPQNQEINFDQREEFIDALNKLEPLLCVEEIDEGVKFLSSEFVVDNCRVIVQIPKNAFVLAKPAPTQPDLPTFSWRVVQESTEDVDGNSNKRIKTFSVSKDLMTQELSPYYDEDIEFKLEGEDKYKAIPGLTDKIFGKITKAYLENKSQEEIQKILEEAKEEYASNSKLEELTGEYASRFTQDRLREVMGIIFKLNEGNRVE